MKILGLSIIVVLPLLLASCSGVPGAVSTAGPTALTVTPTPTPSRIPTPTATPMPTPTPTPAPGPSDPLFAQQWHLINTGQQAYSPTSGTIGADIHYASTVAQGLRGAGIKILLSDDGLDITHEDIAANFDSTRSRDYTQASPYTGTGEHQGDDDAHGTAVGGIIGAVGYNSTGVRGVAPNIFLASANFLSEMVSQVMAIYVDQANTTADIVNQSWGNSQDMFEPISGTYLTQLRSATASGRSSKGTIFVKAAGNYYFIDLGGDIYRSGNSNFDGYDTTPFTIIVAALDANDYATTYSSPGANLWISGYGGEYGDDAPAIVTTDRTGCTLGFSHTDSSVSDFNGGLEAANANCSYTSAMNGTSSATPIISGAVALILEANPNLTWRDVKHILATTAAQVSASIEDIDDGFIPSPPGHVWEQAWTTNTAGYRFHNWFGFGKIDVDAAVTMAQNYTTNLGTQVEAETSSGTISKSIPDFSATGTTSTINVSQNYVIEGVQIKLSVTHSNVGDLGVELTSPGGTKSILKNVNDSLYGITNMTDNLLMSNAFYGEPSAGTWTVKLIDGNSGTTGTLTNWKINVIGH